MSLYDRDDGILTVYDMNEHEQLRFFNEDKYWNMELKDEFINSTNNLWVGTFSDKRVGQIFAGVNTAASEEEALMQMKVEAEMDAAIKKHGKASIPKSYEEEVQE